MQNPFDSEQNLSFGDFRGFSKDRLGVYKSFKRNMIQKNK
jgi:hypothetical protein